MATKYTVEVLQEAVSKSITFSDVVRNVGLKWSGGSQNHITRLVKEAGIDTSHFIGRRANLVKLKDKSLVDHDELFVKRTDGKRIKAEVLRLAMLAKGIANECKLCGLGPVWNGRPLTLQVDHLDGDYQNNLMENLRFLCPNCHTQTETWGFVGMKGE